MERHKKKVVGRLDKVPCPWCLQPNDFRELGGFAGESGIMVGLENGAVAECDHCKHQIEVVQIDTIPRLHVRQFHKS